VFDSGGALPIVREAGEVGQSGHVLSDERLIEDESRRVLGKRKA